MMKLLQMKEKNSHKNILFIYYSICLIFRVEEYIYETFDKANIKIEVMKGQTMFEKEYPW